MTINTETISQKNFVRDQLAWFSYLMIATYCYSAAALGPVMVFLRSELHIDYSTTAYILCAWSFGSLIAGFSGDKFMQKFGKTRTVWIGCAFFCIGLSTIASAQHPLIALTGSFLCGLAGSTMSQSLFTAMADRFMELRTVAISEANIAASLLCSLAPLLVGMLSKAGPLHWRAALLIPILCYCFYFFVAGRISLDPHPETESRTKKLGTDALPRKYWLCFALIFLSVACEWSIIYWSAEFLESIAKLAKPVAAASVTSFLAAMVTGRILGSRFARSFRPELLLKIASFVALFGFLLFWLNSSAPVCLAGLFIAGLGISNFYPLTLSMAIASAPGLTGRATSRMSMSSGGSCLLAPLLLGLIAQSCGIFAAYGLILVLLLLSCVLVFLPLWKEPISAESK